jgi:hypothetical protein
MSLTPQVTYIALLAVQTVHLAMIAVQIVGSIWIRRLSPAWGTR